MDSWYAVQLYISQFDESDLQEVGVGMNQANSFISRVSLCALHRSVGRNSRPSLPDRCPEKTHTECPHPIAGPVRRIVVRLELPPLDYPVPIKVAHLRRKLQRGDAAPGRLLLLSG